jgi:hypothetical protein
MLVQHKIHTLHTLLDTACVDVLFKRGDVSKVRPLL